MNFELHDILSNPALLHHVPDETLQAWTQQYPYVSLFQLYSLKRNKNYSESDLHKTAFYFNNREKLFFLLKSDKLTPPVIQKENLYNEPAENKIEEAIEEKETVGVEKTISDETENTTNIQEEINT